MLLVQETHSTKEPESTERETEGIEPKRTQYATLVRISYVDISVPRRELLW